MILSNSQLDTLPNQRLATHLRCTRKLQGRLFFFLWQYRFAMHLEVMRRFYLTLFLIGMLPSLFGAEFKLLNGDVITGEPAALTEDGLVVRLDIGGFSPRVGWGKLTQETLKQLMENPQAKPFVEPFIEIPVEIKQK